MLHALLHGLVAQTADGAAGPGLLGSAVPFILIFVVMYFLIIRPQQNQAKTQQKFLAEMKKGDEVVLQSGFFAKVQEVREADVTVELAPNVRVRVLKSTVQGPSPLSEAALAAKAGEKTEKKS